MKEEIVTKNVLDWLEINNWEIVCYDFPQSGTGILLHLNVELRTTKNKGGLIPDIVVVKKEIALFFENKDRFVESDFQKTNELRKGNNYSESIDRLLRDFKVKKIYYGIAIPFNKKEIVKSENHLDKIDFLISTNLNKDIFINYDNYGVFE